jgi:hypothetical protein
LEVSLIILGTIRAAFFVNGSSISTVVTLGVPVCGDLALFTLAAVYISTFSPGTHDVGSSVLLGAIATILFG